jgi:hypothetical protein
MKQLILFLILLMISLFGFVISYISNDQLLNVLSWISSVSLFFLILLNLFTKFLNQ